VTPETVVPSSLELDPTQFRLLVEQVLDRVGPYLASLPTQSVSDTTGAEAVATALREAMPRRGRPLGELLDLLFAQAIPPSFNPASPGYLAYIPGGGILHAAAADLLADAVNRYVGVRAASPTLTEIEANAVRWLGEIVGYSASARGTLTSGGSVASWIALVTARRARLGEGEAVLRATLYASDQVHHAVTRAAVLTGFPAGHVRSIPSDAQYRLRLDALQAAIVADRAAGLAPFLVVGSAGTTNTGAVDPLAALADLTAAEGLWLHVDAAYGGFFMLTERGRRAMAGIERADSVVLDPHKGLFLPYGTGAVLVRDGEALRRAHHVAADYLPPLADDPDLVDFHELSPELSRPFRGLRVWLPVSLLGSGAFAAALDEKLDLAGWIAREVAAMPALELVAAPQLSVLAFAPPLPAGLAARWRRAVDAAPWPAAERATAHAALAAELAPENERTAALLTAINRPQRVYLTPTTLAGRLVIRICVLSFRTHAERLAMCRDDIAAAVEQVLAARPAPQASASPTASA
jgi:aromatic-L-amino-acid decarboxylase